MRGKFWNFFAISSIAGSLYFAASFFVFAAREAYVFTTFDGGAFPNPGMEMLFSEDGVNFTSTRGQWFFTDANVRDPLTIKIGKWYYVLYTTSYPMETSKLGLKKSQDLVNWVTVPMPDFAYLQTPIEKQIWVGCWYYEAGIYYIYFCTAINSQRPYVMTFDPSTDTCGLPQEVVFNSQPEKIDIMAIVKVGNVYHAFIQDNNSSGNGFYLTHATSTNLITGWTVVDSGDWAGWGWNEAPQLCVKPDGTYRMYMIHFADNHYTYYSDSADLKTWTPIKKVNATCWNGSRPGNGTVSVFRSPEITSVNAASFAQQASGSFQVMSTGTPLLSVTGLPSWAAFNPVSDVLSGTPPQFGTYSFTIKATNGIPPDVTQTFTLTVQATFDQWAQAYFTEDQMADMDLSGAAATPLDDGVSNLLKYFSGINPAMPMTDSDRAALPTVRRVGQWLTLTYRKNRYLTGVTFDIQTSETLQSWQTVVPSQTDFLGLDVVTGDFCYQAYVSTGGAANKYIRLRVTQP